MRVFVVGWHPAPGSGANGGFEWRYNRLEALREMASLVVLETSNDGPRHNLVFAELEVPFEVDYDRPRTYSDREPEITEWLDANLHLIELPEGDVVVSVTQAQIDAINRRAVEMNEALEAEDDGGGITSEGLALGHRYVMGNVNAYCPKCSDEQGVTVLDCDYDLDK